LDVLVWARVGLWRRDPSDLAGRVNLFSWVAENMCAIHGVEVIVEGTVPACPSVLIARHMGYVDPLAIVCTLPAALVARREVATWPVTEDMARRLGVLFVPRSSPHGGARVLLQAKRALEAGVSTLFFPEEACTGGHDVLPSSRGPIGLAARLGLPIVPVAVRYDDGSIRRLERDTFLPNYVRAATRPRIRAHTIYGEPIAPRTGETARVLAERVRSGFADDA
jgi:1-acyl-sn-glycerol-3-phosphate acyltransferase